MTQTQGVAHQALRQIGGDLDMQTQTFLLRSVLHLALGIADHLARIVRYVLHLHVAGFDLREIENIVDDAQ